MGKPVQGTILTEPAELSRKAAQLRLDVLHTVAKAKKGHVGGALSVLDILVSLFHGGFLRYELGRRLGASAVRSRCASIESGQDRFILSKGHCSVALYAVLADLGFFPREELSSYNTNGGLLGEHPDYTIPGVETSSGSLGNGLGIGAGLAWAAKLDGKETRVFVVLGDGECHEGAVWEAALFASHHRLNNLIAIIDRNGYCVHDTTENIVRLEPFEDKWQSFAWNTRRLNGHDFPSLREALRHACEESSGPTVLIADTIKGKGVSFMENKAEWHHGVVQGPSYDRAVVELEACLQ